MIVLVARRGGRRVLLPPRRGPLPVRRPAHASACAPSCPAPPPRRWRRRSRSEIEEVVNTVQGITRAAVHLRARHSPSSSSTFDLSRNIDVAAQDVRDKVATAIQQPAARRQAADHLEVRQRPGARPHGGGLRRTCPLRELTEIADKIVKVQLERALRRRRGAPGRRPRPRRSTSGSRRTASPPTGSPSPRCATRSCARTPTCPGGNVTAGLREQSLRTHGARRRSPRRSRTWWSPPSTGRPIRVRDIGRAEDGTKEQRSAGAAQRRADASSSRCAGSRAPTPWPSSRRPRRAWRAWRRSCPAT